MSLGAGGGDGNADDGDLVGVVLQLEGEVQELIVDELAMLLVPE